MVKKLDFVEVLRKCGPFGQLNESKLEQFAAICEERSLSKADVLMKEGERGDDLYVVASGRFDVYITNDGKEKKISEVKVGNLLGEGQLLTGGERTATIKAAVASKVLVMSRQPWLDLCRDTEIPSHLMSLVRKRFGELALRAKLKERFPSVTEEGIQELIEISNWRFLKDREFLFKEGDASESIFFLLQGRMMVRSRGSKVGEILAGDTIGESALADGGTRSASIVSIRPCLLAQISRKEFIDVAHRHPSLLLDVISVMQARISGSKEQGRGVSHHIISVMSISQSIDASTLENLFRNALGARKNVRVLSEAEVISHFNSPDILKARDGTPEELGLQMYFESLEADYEHLVLLAGPKSEEWAVRCALNANQIILVADEGDSGDLTDVEKVLDGRLRGILPSKMMVLLRPEGTRPNNTKRWHKNRHLDHLLQVEKGMQDDNDRLGRYVTKTTVGLCISGGGAYGFAGIGVISAMLELGIPIDGLGGASAGAMIAALYAYNDDYEEMLAMMKKLLFRQNIYGFLDGTNPNILAMTKGRYYRKAIKHVFGDISIEDLLVPCLFLSANVTSAKQCVANRGPFVEHFYATNAYPPFLPPAVIDGELHVDGGLMNNVPVAEVKDLVRGGHTLAVDVTPLKIFHELTETPEGLTGMDVLMSRLNPKGDPSKKWPTKWELNSRLKMVNHVATMQTRKDAADLYLQPDMTTFRIWDHRKYLKIAHHAHNQVIESLSDWWDSAKPD